MVLVEAEDGGPWSWVEDALNVGAVFASGGAHSVRPRGFLVNQGPCASFDLSCKYCNALLMMSILHHMVPFALFAATAPHAPQKVLL